MDRPILSIAATEGLKTCRRGHIMNAANTYVRPKDGGTECRQCKVGWLKAWRARQPRRIPRTHCKNGHELVPENLAWTINRGRRIQICRLCRNASSKRNRAWDNDLCRAKRRAKRAGYDLKANALEPFLELEKLKKELRALTNPLEARIQKDSESGCWLWTGHRKSNGYAEVIINGKAQLIHRLFYEKFFGPIIKDQILHHTCATPHCVNPTHLLPTTRREHVLDLHPTTTTALNKAKLILQRMGAGTAKRVITIGRSAATSNARLCENSKSISGPSCQKTIPYLLIAEPDMNSPRIISTSGQTAPRLASPARLQSDSSQTPVLATII